MRENERKVRSERGLLQFLRKSQLAGSKPRHYGAAPFPTPMNASRSLFCLSIAALLALASWSWAQLPAAPAQVGRDQTFMVEAERLQAEGKYKEALEKYLSVPREVATSPFIPGSNLGAAICYFFLKDYDKAAGGCDKEPFAWGQECAAGGAGTKRSDAPANLRG
jgi:hypothetical protein